MNVFRVKSLRLVVALMKFSQHTFNHLGFAETRSISLVAIIYCLKLVNKIMKKTQLTLTVEL